MRNLTNIILFLGVISLVASFTYLATTLSRRSLNTWSAPQQNAAAWLSPDHPLVAAQEWLWQSEIWALGYWETDFESQVLRFHLFNNDTSDYEVDVPLRAADNSIVLVNGNEKTVQDERVEGIFTNLVATDKLKWLVRIQLGIGAAGSQYISQFLTFETPLQ